MRSWARRDSTVLGIVWTEDGRTDRRTEIAIDLPSAAEIIIQCITLLKLIYPDIGGTASVAIQVVLAGDQSTRTLATSS